MSAFAKLTLRSWIGLLVMVSLIVIGGTWTAVKITTDYLLHQNATVTARDWAQYLVWNVTDLEQIAAGEQPSTASMAFFRAARNANQVFRYVVFDRSGHSQLLSDRHRIALVDLSEFSEDAARAAATEKPIVQVVRGETPDSPAFMARAYIPVLSNGEPVAVVAAYVDQTEQRNNFQRTFLIAGFSLCLLTGLSFAIPAIAWYRRSKEKQQADRRLRFLAHHDALTGLANRPRLIERLEAALNEARAGECCVAVHFIDLDRFKEVNDTLGHDGGDFLLKSVAGRLTAAVRAEDTVARLGGDEFVVVQANIAGKEDAESFSQRLLAAMTAPLQFNATEIACLGSVGVAVAPDDGDDAERILKSADLALYRAKTEGRNCIRFFEPEMDEALLSKLRLERTIREAIANNKFELHFQPVFEVSGRELIGFEALARLPADDGSFIPPSVFIPAAEEMHLIDKVGSWVLRQACQAASTWPTHLKVAVNLSPAQFSGTSISQMVAEALGAAGIEPRRLELEITEGLLLGDSEQVMTDLRALKKMGVAIVMDDFGTGYSSLSYLWRFPFDKIKIDRSFMRGFDGTDRDAETVVKTIIALGRELQMHVTVEGVETAHQAAFLDEIDADQVQGFFFGRPVPATEVAAEILNDNRRRTRRPVQIVHEDKATPRLGMAGKRTA